jgi:hypothetical protein
MYTKYTFLSRYRKVVDILDCLRELPVHEEHFSDFHPDRKAATKGGSLAGIFAVQIVNANRS